MPSPLSAPLPLMPAQGFLPAFFTHHTPAPRAGKPSEAATAAAGHAGTRYDADRDGPHHAFCGGSRFADYRREVLDDLEFIIDLSRQRNMPDAAAIEERFRTFYRHRFEESYFDVDEELPLIDSAGKRALDNFRAMLAHPALRPDQQVAAIRELSLGVAVCASGTTANLIAADRELALSVDGLRGRLWLVKEQIVRDVLRQQVAELYGAFEIADECEIHYVNDLWNVIADGFGLQRIDGHAQPDDAGGYDASFIASCRGQVIAALAPDRIASRIAEECLSIFRSRTVSDAGAPFGACDAGQWRLLEETVDDIRGDLGLAASQLGLDAFLELHDDGRFYRVRDDPALIALALLKAMNAERLLADTPVRLADSVDGDGRRAEVFMYGSLLGWQLQRAVPTSAAAPTSAWDAHAGAEPVDLSALLGWLAGDGQAPVELAPDAPPARLHGAHPDELMKIPAEWLGSARALLGLLERLPAEQAAAYLGHNLPYLLTGLPVEDRDLLLDRAVHLGEPGRILARAWQSELWLVLHLDHGAAVRYLRDNLRYLADTIPAYSRGQWMDEIMHLEEPARDLARAWYPDAWTLLTQSTQPLRGTRLAYWVQCDHVRALESVCQLVAEGWGAGSVSASSGQGVSTMQGRICAWCLDEEGNVAVTKDAATIEAARRLLRQLSFTSPASEQFGRRLSTLLPGNVLYVLETGSAPTARAFRGLLTDRELLPRIGPDLPAILCASGSYAGYPMSYVLATGKTGFIAAYGAWLADMASMPDGARWIVPLLMPKWMADPAPPASGLGRRSGCYALLDASTAGATKVIEAYHQILVHPGILPHILNVLPELVLGAPPIDPRTRHRRWPAARYEVLESLFNMAAPGYPAYGNLVKDPRILPHIVDAVPRTAIIIRARLEGRGVVADLEGPQAPARKALRHRVGEAFRRVKK
ncbi:hypothetical protein BOSP111201_24175 [Bordetella sputigena]|uniref:hypothetical protein n=1 Tax=Bordetella sputigena TaxID=1416810 RepID=UPI0039EE8BDC